MCIRAMLLFWSNRCHRLFTMCHKNLVQCVYVCANARATFVCVFCLLVFILLSTIPGIDFQIVKQMKFENPFTVIYPQCDMFCLWIHTSFGFLRCICVYICIYFVCSAYISIIIWCDAHSLLISWFPSFLFYSHTQEKKHTHTRQTVIAKYTNI